MPGGSRTRLQDLPWSATRIIDESRRAALSTVGSDGTISVVPVCFAVDGETIVTQVDDKPKRDGELARVRNVRREPRATLLFDRWDEDWTRLGWVMVKGIASVEPPRLVPGLLDRYPQYERRPGGPVIVVAPRRIRWWTWE